MESAELFHGIAALYVNTKSIVYCRDETYTLRR